MNLVLDGPGALRFPDDRLRGFYDAHLLFVEDRLVLEAVPLFPQFLVDPNIRKTDGYLTAQHSHEGDMIRRKGVVPDPSVQAQVPSISSPSFAGMQMSG